MDDMEQTVDDVEAANLTECPTSSKVNLKYKGPDGLMIDIRKRSWGEEFQDAVRILETIPNLPSETPIKSALSLWWLLRIL